MRSSPKNSDGRSSRRGRLKHLERSTLFLFVFPVFAFLIVTVMIVTVMLTTELLRIGSRLDVYTMVCLSALCYNGGMYASDRPLVGPNW